MPRKTFLPKFPYSYIDKKAEEYDSQKWMERNQKKTTLKCIQYLFDKKLGEGSENIQRDKPYLILDLGCGTGFSSEILIENGFRVIGVEILNDMLVKAKVKKKNYNYINVELILADINYLPLRKKSIDHIFSISAYNFITHGSSNSPREKRKIINNTSKYLNKILKKNGRIIIEFYPKDDKELNFFISSFTDNGFDGFMVKNKPNQKSGQTFLLLKKIR